MFCLGLKEYTIKIENDSIYVLWTEYSTSEPSQTMLSLKLSPAINEYLIS